MSWRDKVPGVKEKEMMKKEERLRKKRSENREELEEKLAEIEEKYPMTRQETLEVDYETWQITFADGSEKKVSGVVEEEEDELLIKEPTGMSVASKGHRRMSYSVKTYPDMELKARLSKGDYGLLEKIEERTFIIQQEIEIECDTSVREGSIAKRVYGKTLGEPKMGFDL